MGTLKFKGKKIFTGKNMMEPGMVVITDDTGKILDFIPGTDAGEDICEVRGTILPGFVNAHCHLELSHMHGNIQGGTGLPNFLSSVVGQRSAPEEEVIAAMQNAADEMYARGVSAVGDICNTTDSIAVKKDSALQWVNFIEVLSATDEKAIDRLDHFESICRAFQDGLRDATGSSRSTLAAHAPYSVSPKSLGMINARTAGEVTSIHMQETAAENELFLQGTGPFTLFFSSLGYAACPVNPTGKSSLCSVLPYFDNQQQLILVHNTFTTEQDLAFAAAWASEKKLGLAYCLCPNANLYIENTLPPVRSIAASGAEVILGTDSLASNHSLSIAEEIKTLLQHFPELALETVLQWATYNGARALRVDDSFGKLEIGLRPGLIWLDDDFNSGRLI